MIARAEFRTDLSFAEEMRPLIERELYARFAYNGRFVSLVGDSAGVMFLQREGHIDAVVQVAADKCVTTEEKIVRRKHTAFAVETHSNLEKCALLGSADGWIWTSTADILVYAFGVERGLEAWTLSLPDLREWFRLREDSFPYSDTPNYIGGRLAYHTRCRIVSIQAIDIKKTRYELIDRG